MKAERKAKRKPSTTPPSVTAKAIEIGVALMGIVQAQNAKMQKAIDEQRAVSQINAPGGDS